MPALTMAIHPIAVEIFYSISQKSTSWCQGKSQEGTFSENVKNCLRIYMDVVSDQMFKELHPIRTCCVVR